MNIYRLLFTILYSCNRRDFAVLFVPERGSTNTFPGKGWNNYICIFTAAFHAKHSSQRKDRCRSGDNPANEWWQVKKFPCTQAAKLKIFREEQKLKPRPACICLPIHSADRVGRRGCNPRDHTAFTGWTSIDSCKSIWVIIPSIKKSTGSRITFSGRDSPAAWSKRTHFKLALPLFSLIRANGILDSCPLPLQVSLFTRYPLQFPMKS